MILIFLYVINEKTKYLKKIISLYLSYSLRHLCKSNSAIRISHKHSFKLKQNSMLYCFKKYNKLKSCFINLICYALLNNFLPECNILQLRNLLKFMYMILIYLN